MISRLLPAAIFLALAPSLRADPGATGPTFKLERVNTKSHTAIVSETTDDAKNRYFVFDLTKTRGVQKDIITKKIYRSKYRKAAEYTKPKVIQTALQTTAAGSIIEGLPGGVTLRFVPVGLGEKRRFEIYREQQGGAKTLVVADLKHAAEHSGPCEVQLYEVDAGGLVLLSSSYADVEVVRISP